MSILNKYFLDDISIYQAISALEDKNDKNNGVCYTPKYIADYIVSSLNYDPKFTIIEPSVGHGIFLFSLIEYVENKFQLNSKEIKNWFENKVYAFDINANIIDELKQLLIIYFKKKNIEQIDLSKIKSGDPLFENKKHYDYCFGNPPYVRIKNIDINYLNKLRKKYVFCSKGNIDLFYAFIEFGLIFSNKTSFIVPNGFIHNSSAKILRQDLLPHLDQLIDFKSSQIFNGVDTYTSIILFDKKSQNDHVSYLEDLNGEHTLFLKNTLKDNQWIFKDLKLKGKSLLDYCSFYSGVATLCDKYYLIEGLNEDETGKYWITKFNNTEYLIEKSICLDFYKMTKLNKNFKIIHPYDKTGNIIKEDLLIKNYPKTYQYFLALKPILMSRDKGKTDKYKSWYAYGREQGMIRKKEKYLLFLPMMSSETYTAYAYNCLPEFLLVSGYALGFNSKTIRDEVQKIISSDIFFNYISSVGKVWKGKSPYYSFSKRHLRDFKIDL